VNIVYNIKKVFSVMCADRDGRKLSPPKDVPPAARKRVSTSSPGHKHMLPYSPQGTPEAIPVGPGVMAAGGKKKSETLLLAKSPTLLTPEEAASLRL